MGQILHDLQSLKYLPSSSLQEKFTKLWFRQLQFFTIRKQYSHDAFMNNLFSFWLLSWDTLPEMSEPAGMSTLMGLYMWCQIVFYKDCTNFHWPQGCVRMPVSSRSPLMTLYFNLRMFWSCICSHLLDMATCVTAFHHDPIYKAHTSLRHSLCKTMAHNLKSSWLRSVMIVFWDNKYLFGSSLSISSLNRSHSWVGS